MIRILIVLLLLFLCFPPPAQAYLDPGTGSYITQILIGSIVGAGYLVKVYWHRITQILHGLLHRKRKEDGKQIK